MINSQMIENIYFSVEKGEICKKEAENRLVTLISKEPQFYGLEKLNSDELQEIIFKLINKMDSIFENYDKTRNTKFSTYFQLIVRFTYQSWRKNKASEDIKNTIIKNINNNEVYEREKANIYSPENILETLPMINDNNVNNEYSGLDMKLEKRKNPELELLIIALKSSHILTENQITQISKFTKIERSKLIEIIEKVNKKLSNRKLQIKHLEKMINKDYFKIEEIKIKLTLPKYNEIDKKVFQEKIEVLTKRKNKNTEKLKSIKLVPSDKIISDILNVTPGKIRYYINRNYKIYNISPKPRKNYQYISND